WVYSGPMGAVLIPGLIGIDEAGHLPNASTFCGKCEEVCPMRIPLPSMLRSWRRLQFEQRKTSATSRVGLGLWAFLARWPRLYRLALGLGIAVLGKLGRAQGRFRWLPFGSAWTGLRDFPAPEGRTFQSRWQRERRGGR
ncbi:MAG: lactate utilization protein, partial [Rhodospirillales bacterium]|nr:lactate utilization protein [Rhodospirillales bacterium]